MSEPLNDKRGHTATTSIDADDIASSRTRAPLNSRLQRVLARHRTDSDACMSLAHQNRALRQQAKKSAAEHAREISKVCEERDRHQKCCDSLRNDKQALENSLQAATCQHSQLAKDHRALLERANAAELRVEQLQQSLADSGANMTALQRKLDVDTSSRTHEEKSSEAKDGDSCLHEASWADKIHNLEDLIRVKDEKYCRMECELRSYIAELEKVSDGRHSELVKQYEEKLSKMKTVYTEKISSWEHQVTELTTALTKTSTRYSELELRLTQSNAECDLLKAREAAVIAELSILKRERQKISSLSRREITRYSTVIQRLKELYVAKESEFDKLLAKNAATEADLEAFEKLLDSENAHLDACRRRKRRKTTHNESVTLTPLPMPPVSDATRFSS